MRIHPLGIYEKALPKDLTWKERFEIAKQSGFDYVEMSVDETDERLSRLDWTKQQRKDFVSTKIDCGILTPSMCLSGHRKYPFGSHDPKIRQRAYDIMAKAIELANDLGIRNIQLAGSDVYYEEQDEGTLERYDEGMRKAVEMAAGAQVMLATEIMDTPFMSSITKWQRWNKMLNSPWFGVYPDVGNLTAWNNDLDQELSSGIDKITAIHLKETLPVSNTCKGQFRDLQFGEGTVDFVNIFKILKKLNYRGSFMLEMWGDKVDDPIGKIVKAREYIEQKMAEANYQP